MRTIVIITMENALSIFIYAKGDAMDTIIYWGTFILILLAGLGVFGMH